MKILIAGGGQVGREIAAQLVKEGNSITVIDVNEELTQRISKEMDVRAVTGFASYPDVLEQAGANDTDIIIAVTNSDEVNILICKIAQTIFQIPKKIARIRSQNYLMPEWQDLFNEKDMVVDIIISPEKEVAKSIIDRLHIRGASESISFAGSRIRVVALKSSPHSSIRESTIRKLATYLKDLNIKIIGIVRDLEFLLPDPDEVYKLNDELFIACDSLDLKKLMSMFGHGGEELKNHVIVGGGNIGLFIAESFEQDNYDYVVKLVEMNEARAEYIAEKLKKTIVIHGSILDQAIIDEVHIGETDNFIAVTNDDKVNIISSLLAKNLGADNSVALVNNTAVFGPISPLGIDVTIDPSETTVSTILSKIKAEKGLFSKVHALASGNAELIEVYIKESSTLIGELVENVENSDGVYVLAILRKDQVIITTPKTNIMHGDTLLLLSMAFAIPRLEEQFSSNFEYFK